jgi:hypothetical protein
LSKRQGGEQLSRIAASLFLPLVMSGFWIAVTIYVAIRVDGRPVQWANIFLTALNWVVLPSLALLFGALPFLGVRRSIAGKEVMNYRTKTLWLPGLISLAAAMIVFTISTRVGLQPQFLARGLSNAVVYLGWLLPLPFCGAIGAFLSRRAGGQRLAPPRSRSVSSHRDGCSGWVPDAYMPDRVGQTSRVQLDPWPILWDGPARRGALAGHHTVFDCVTIWKYALSVVLRDGLQICLS